VTVKKTPPSKIVLGGGGAASDLELKLELDLDLKLELEGLDSINIIGRKEEWI
jgi:hypothetical protein